MKAKRIVLWTTGSLFALLLLTYFIAGCLAGDSALHPARTPMTTRDLAEAQQIAARDHASLQDAGITAADGAVLRGWLLRPATRNGDAVLLLHGHGGNRAGLLSKADMFLRHGFTVLLPDARAHGQSGGQIATFGVLEADDDHRWFNWLQSSEHPHCIDGLGTSMGAAMILEAMRTTPGLCAVVADAPFDSFREVSYERLSQDFGAGEWLGRTLLRPIVDIGFLYVRLRYGVDMEAASPDAVVASSRVPVLLIHGEADTNLPIRHSRLIVEHSLLRQPMVVFWAVPGAEHCKAQEVEPVLYERRVIDWFEMHR
jgi:hypothetical protein